MRLVDEDYEIAGEVEAHLLQRLDVVLGALAQSIRLKFLPLLLGPRDPLIQMQLALHLLD